MQEPESYFPAVNQEMNPRQQSSPSSKPFSDEETQLFYIIRDSMDETFAVGKVGLWQEVSRRLEAFKHHRSPQELEAKFGQYRPLKRPTKKRKRTVPAKEQEQAPMTGCSTLQQDRQQQAQDRLARSQQVEAARKKLLEKIDLKAFFDEGNTWENAIVSLRQSVRSSTTDTGDKMVVETSNEALVETSNGARRSRRAHKANSRVTGPEWS